MTISGMAQEKYAILDTANLIYTYNTDNSLIMAAVEDEAMLSIINRVSNGESKGVVYGADDIIAFESLPKYNLILPCRIPPQRYWRKQQHCPYEHTAYRADASDSSACGICDSTSHHKAAAQGEGGCK